MLRLYAKTLRFYNKFYTSIQDTKGQLYTTDILRYLSTFNL